MEKFSKNKKLNGVLNVIFDDVVELGEDVKRYYKEFKGELDYNIVQYGNMLVYYNDIKNMYKSCGYKSIEKMSDEKVWDIYKRQVGYITRYIIHNNII